MRGDAYSAEAAVDSVVARLNGVSEYVALFALAFEREGPIVEVELGAALAAFQRTLVAIDSPFDRFQSGELTALSEVQRRGPDVSEKSIGQRMRLNAIAAIVRRLLQDRCRRPLGALEDQRALRTAWRA
jgi:hypothetical protein